jgi:hypothetical protein
MSHVAQITNSFMFSGESNPLTNFLNDHNFHVTTLLVAFFTIHVKSENFKSCFVATKEPQVVFIKENWPKNQPWNA